MPRERGGGVFDPLKDRGSELCQTTSLLAVALYLGENGVTWYERVCRSSNKRVRTAVAAFNEYVRWTIVRQMAQNIPPPTPPLPL